MDFGLIVDVETTGLNPEKDKIIEVGLLEFAVEKDQAPTIVEVYGAMEDPGIEIPTEITKLTGIKNDLLKNRVIDWLKVKSHFKRASIVIAHNAKFDRSFLLRRSEVSEEVKDVHWACSIRHIDWKKKGMQTKVLGYLAAEHGFLNPFSHRAVFDCATTFKLISPYLDEIIKKSYEKEYKLLAIGAPFEVKDELKSRGYRWDQNLRVWSTIVTESDLESERKFLEEVVYKGVSHHQEVLIS